MIDRIFKICRISVMIISITQGALVARESKLAFETIPLNDGTGGAEIAFYPPEPGAYIVSIKVYV